MKCPVCAEVTRVKQTRWIGGSAHRIRVCGCGHRFTTIEMVMVSGAGTLRKQPSVVGRALRALATRRLPEWAERAARQVVAGKSLTVAAAEEGRSGGTLALWLAPDERRARVKAAKARLRKNATPEQKMLAKLRREARAVAKERGVPREVVYREWGCL